MPHLSIRIDFDDEGRLGPGKVALLERIASEGSISAAGRSMNMSYKRAWELVSEINRTFEEPLVTAQTGGRAGGGAVLTRARPGADPPLPRHRAQGAVGDRPRTSRPCRRFPAARRGHNALSSRAREVRMARIKVRKGMPSVALNKAEFAARARERFFDPAFEPLQAEIGKIIDAAWDGYHNYRKAPRTRKAGARLCRSDYDLSVDWSEGARCHPRGRAAAEVGRSASRASC